MPKMNYGNDIGHSLRFMMEQDPAFRTVAYFSMEVGLKASIPTYSGGLGVLAGDILKSAADLGVPIVGVTLLYRKGYFRQSFEDCLQKALPVEWDPEKQLALLPHEVTVMIEGRIIKVRAWCLELQGRTGFTVPIYFLDTDVEGNSPADRELTWYLYGGDERYRLCQEIILGSGGLRMLRDLGYSNIDDYHLNEGHAAFLALELIREMGYENYDRVREEGIFTTHTPVSAGHDHFSWDLINRVMDGSMAARLRRMMPTEDVSMTEIALRYSRYINGVSEKHAQVSRTMYGREDVDCITNGIHTLTWVSPEMAEVFTKYIPGWDNAPERLVKAVQIPVEDIRSAHSPAKKRLLDYVEERTGKRLDPGRLTIGFARRVAQYKRVDLVLRDTARLVKAAAGKVQFIFSGKAHPNDNPAREILRKLLCEAQNMVGIDIPVVFIEDYDMDKAALLVQGVDLWLNNPVRPREASGTSGMKCALNGIPNFSVLDGWWVEGCVEGVTGWSIGPEPKESISDQYDDSVDLDDLLEKLEKVIIPTFYERPREWGEIMRGAIALNASYFNTHRVVREYCEKAYGIQMRGL